MNNITQRERLGATSKFPKWAVAYKYPPEEKQTTIVDIEINVGRTGVLTPTAVLDPVTLSGTSVSRAVLHNQEFIDEKHIAIGDTVLVRKAGEIIPEVVSLVAKGPNAEPYRIPDRCPVCHAPAVRLDGEAAVRCTNDDCPARRFRSIVHFASRGAMDIDGLGPAVVRALIDSGQIADYTGLYTLDRDAVATLERMGDKSADNLLAAIEVSKSRGLSRLLFALGIRGVGERAADDIAARFRTIDAVMDAAEEDIAAIHEIGPVIASNVVQFFTDEHNRDRIARLQAAGVATEYVSLVTSDALAGHTFVVTGTLPTLSRTEAHVLIKEHGGKTSESVSKKTSYVVYGENAGSKLDKARSLGVPLLTEDELRAMLEG